MGTNQTYIAVKGKTKERVWEDLSIEPNNAKSGPAMAADLATGWYLILDKKANLDSEQSLSYLSTDAEVVQAVVVDTCNYSMTSYWKNGQKLWEVIYSQDDGGLSTLGQPPQAYFDLRSQVQARDDVTDDSDTAYMSVPEYLFETYTGYLRDRLVNPCKWGDFIYFDVVDSSNK